MRPLTSIFSGLILALSGLPVLAANVSQSGNVTPGHLTAWATTGVIKDAGTATNPFANTFGLIGGPLCINSGPTTGAYNAFCLQVDGTTGGTVSIYNHGGATGGISFSVNGTAQGIPLVPLPTTAGDVVCFANTAGTLTDCNGTTESANTFFAGPTSGAASAPAFRTIVPADLVSALTTPPPIGSTTPNTGAFTALGIGTTSPLVQLHIVGPSAVGFGFGLNAIQSRMFTGSNSALITTDALRSASLAKKP